MGDNDSTSRSRRRQNGPQQVKLGKPCNKCRSHYKQVQEPRYYNPPAMQTPLNKKFMLKTRRIKPIEGVRPRWDDRVDSERILTVLQSIFNTENFCAQNLLNTFFDLNRNFIQAFFL